MNTTILNEAVGDPRYLVFVDSNNNKNKFYKAYMNSDGNSYTVEYGRIGAPSYQTKVYQGDAYDMEHKIFSKIRKGYQDYTHLIKQALTSSGTSDDGYKAIENTSVNELIKALRKYASDVIKQNYTISSGVITQDMLDTAKEQLDKLNELADKYSKDGWKSQVYADIPYITFNNELEKLFRIIPRKMNKVSNFILPKGLSAVEYDKEADKILNREQQLYNTLLADFQTKNAITNTKNQQSSSTSSPTKTILEDLGLECQLVEDPTTLKQIKDHLGQVVSRFSKAFMVKNNKTQDKYASFMSSMPNCETKLFFHGSRNENFWNILKNGLSLNPKAKITGKMLGNGLYMANKAIKSINYTSLRGSYWSGGTSNVGYLAVFAVAIDPKTAYEVSSYNEISTCYGMTWDKLQKIKPGATHVFAHKGPYLREDELCVYREDQCTIRYLIELK